MKNTKCAELDAHLKIRTFLQNNGFTYKGGNIYFSKHTMDVVECILAIQKLSKTYSWLYPSVKEIEMHRIEESYDLMEVIEY